MIPWHSILAFFSGVFAAAASMCSKFAFSSFMEDIICKRMQEDQWMVDLLFFGDVECQTLMIPLRCFMVVCLVLCNLLMWRTFTKAMSLSPTTFEVTVVNTAANFLVSAWIGFLVFGETYSITWYMGVSLIIVGLAVLHRASTVESEKQKMKGE